MAKKLTYNKYLALKAIRDYTAKHGAGVPVGINAWRGLNGFEFRPTRTLDCLAKDGLIEERLTADGVLRTTLTPQGAARLAEG